jgi:hypothetical protein
VVADSGRLVLLLLKPDDNAWTTLQPSWCL